MAVMDSVIMNSPWNGDQERFRLNTFTSFSLETEFGGPGNQCSLCPDARNFEIVDTNHSSRVVFENLKLKKRRSSDYYSPSWMSKQRMD